MVILAGPGVLPGGVGHAEANRVLEALRSGGVERWVAVRQQLVRWMAQARAHARRAGAGHGWPAGGKAAGVPVWQSVLDHALAQQAAGAGPPLTFMCITATQREAQGHASDTYRWYRPAACVKEGGGQQRTFMSTQIANKGSAHTKMAQPKGDPWTAAHT